MRTERILKGRYLTENGYLIVNNGSKWDVINQVTGEVYSTVSTKKEAVDYCNY